MAAAWDAFISYARAESGQAAVAIQRGLERFARPWHQRRAVRVFRDDSALSTNPALWAAIEDGLAAAGHLVVLLGPAARESAYVDREVGWWLDHKGADTILLVLVGGTLGWDATRERFSDDSAVPPRLRDAFADEPRWLDLRWLPDSPGPTADPRFAAAMADLSAPIRGLPRDELVGEDLVQHRRARRLARSAVTALALLLVVSIISTVLAIRQRDDVLRQAVTLRARGMASTASGLLDSDLRLAQLLAVQGYRTEPSAATGEALRQAAFASPLVDRFATFEAELTALAASADGTAVAVGLADGRVFTVAAEGAGTPVLRASVSGPVTALRAAGDGTVLLVGTRDGVSIVDQAGARGLPELPVPATAIALSESGRRAAVVTGELSAEVVVYDTATGAEVARHRDPLAPLPETPMVVPQYTSHLAFVTDATLRLVGVDARWAELDVRTGRTSRAGSVFWTPTSELYATSVRGDYLLSAPIAGGQAVRAWPLDRAGRDRPPLTAGVQVTDPLGLAISPDGRLVLVNDSSTGLSVAPVRRTDELPIVPATRVPGLSGVTAMEFTSPTRAVVAARTGLAFLRFGGVGRGAASVGLVPRGVGSVSNYAVDFRNSGMAVSPGGSRLAVLELNYAELEVVPLPGRQGRAVGRTFLMALDQADALLGPLWLDDDTVAVLSAQAGGTEPALPEGVRLWSLDLPAIDADGTREAPLAAVRAGTDTVLVATSGGRVQRRAIPGGELVGDVRSAAAGGFDLARFSADARYVAMVETGEVGLDGTASGEASLRVVEAATGEVVHEAPLPVGGGVAGLEWAGTTVLVSQLDGAVDVLPDLARGVGTRIATAGIRTSTGSNQRNPPVVGADGLVGFPTRSGLQLYDLATMQPAGAVPVPPGLEAVPRTYAFGPDGHTLVTGFFGADQRTARASVRDLAVEAVVAGVCASAGGAITTTEWLRLVGDAPGEPGCR